MPSLAGFPEFSRETADPLKNSLYKSSSDFFHRCQITTVQSDSPTSIPETATSFENQCDWLYGTLSNFCWVQCVLTVFSGWTLDHLDVSPPPALEGRFLWSWFLPCHFPPTCVNRPTPPLQYRPDLLETSTSRVSHPDTLCRVKEHLLHLVDMSQNDVRLGQSQGNDKESERENNIKKSINEPLNHWSIFKTVKVYSVHMYKCIIFTCF